MNVLRPHVHHRYMHITETVLTRININYGIVEQDTSNYINYGIMEQDTSNYNGYKEYIGEDI